MTELVRFAVGVSNDSWDSRFAAALDEHIARGAPVRYDFIDFRKNTWWETLGPYDVVLWKPANMGLVGKAQFLERIWFIEKQLGKLIIPNYDSVWHFESKIAQHYLFSHHNVPMPTTTVTFDYHDARHRLAQSQFPLVFKKAEGASSKNVHLVRTPRHASKLLRNAFCEQMYREAKRRGGSRLKTVFQVCGNRWFWEFLRLRWTRKEPLGYLYWQEYLSANDADLRITVIGDRWAYGFWRTNRPSDFRASGSGRIDYCRQIPEEPLRYCIEFSRRLSFDSMAYDILFRDDEFVIGEISYGYLDSAPYNAAGYFELGEDGNLKFITGHVWPQSLWVDWALLKVQQARRNA